LVCFDSLDFLCYQALLIAPTPAEPLFITRTSEAPCTWELSCIQQALFYDTAQQDPLRVLADALTNGGLAQANIGLEMATFTFSAQNYLALQSHLPKAQFKDASLKVAGIVAQALRQAGSGYAAISPMCASGRRSSMTHAMPQRQTISQGDLVIFGHAGVCNRRCNEVLNRLNLAKTRVHRLGWRR